MDSDDRTPDAWLREALTLPPRAAARIAADALSRSGARGERIDAAASRGRRSSLPGWAAAFGLAGFALGAWLAMHGLPEPTLLIANQGDVFALRDARGATHLLGRASARDDRLEAGPVGPGRLVLVLHGGVR